MYYDYNIYAAVFGIIAAIVGFWGTRNAKKAIDDDDYHQLIGAIVKLSISVNLIIGMFLLISLSAN